MNLAARVTGGTFCKVIPASYQQDSIIFDVAILQDARRAGAQLIEVLDRESGRLFSAPIDQVLSGSLALRFWSVTEPDRKIDEQPSLFGGAA